MIISKTPLRISLFGGGTDIEAFWSQEDGCVLNCTINMYIYVIVKKSFDNLIHIKYFKYEEAKSVEEIKHDLIREAMKKVGVNGGVEVVVLSDIPHTGSGLGSSSSLTVGLLNAFYAYMGKAVDPEQLAQQACEIEINRLGKPIGKQDQYIAAYGGLRLIRFKTDGNVELQMVKPEYDIYTALKKHLLLFNTGVGRKAETILQEQSIQVVNTRPILRNIRDQAITALDIIETGEITCLGELLRDGWLMKKQLATEISNGWIDSLVNRALEAGALGTKITGAGGGGGFLVFCKPELHCSIRNALSELNEIEFELEPNGTSVYYINLQKLVGKERI